MPGESRSEVRLKLMEEAVNTTNEQINKLVGKVDSLEAVVKKQNQLIQQQSEEFAEIKKIQEAMNGISAENRFLRNKIKEIDNEIENMIKAKNRKWIEIAGLPENDSVNIKEVVMALTKKAKVECLECNLKTIRRLPSKAGKLGTVHIKFNEIAIRDKVLKEVRKLKPRQKDLGFSGNANVYVNEILSYRLKKLLYNAKQAAKSKSWLGVWVYAGAVFIRKEQGGNQIKIETMEDLEQLIK